MRVENFLDLLVAQYKYGKRVTALRYFVSIDYLLHAREVRCTDHL